MLAHSFDIDGVKVDGATCIVLMEDIWDWNDSSESALPPTSPGNQDEEVCFATGRHIRYGPVRLPFAEDDVVALVRQNFAGRVRFVDGDSEVAPGVRVHLMGGHSRCLQAVSVPTRRGLLVLASDAAHFFENITTENPFPIVIDVAQNCESYDRSGVWPQVPTTSSRP